MVMMNWLQAIGKKEVEVLQFLYKIKLMLKYAGL